MNRYAEEERRRIRPKAFASLRVGSEKGHLTSTSAQSSRVVTPPRNIFRLIRLVAVPGIWPSSGPTRPQLVLLEALDERLDYVEPSSWRSTRGQGGAGDPL